MNFDIETRSLLRSSGRREARGDHTRWLPKLKTRADLVDAT